MARVKRPDRSQLMDDHLRPRARNSLRYLVGINGIGHDRLRAQLLQKCPL
jgi:hypothetical protein